MLLIPDAMNAGLDNGLFWGSLAVPLLIAGAAAFPVNWWLIARGKGARSSTSTTIIKESTRTGAANARPALRSPGHHDGAHVHRHVCPDVCDGRPHRECLSECKPILYGRSDDRADGSHRTRGDVGHVSEPPNQSSHRCRKLGAL